MTPRIGRPVIANGRTPSPATAAPTPAAPIRMISPPPQTPTVRWPRVKNVSPPDIFFSMTPEGPSAGRRVLSLGAHTLELAERPPVNQQSALHLGEGRSHLVIVLLRERCGQVLPEPVEMLADDTADPLVARGPLPGVPRRSAGRRRPARPHRHPTRPVPA